MNKKDLTILLLIIVFIIAFIYMLILAFTPTEKDKDAYNKCMEQYGNTRACQKLVNGNY